MTDVNKTKDMSVLHSDQEFIFISHALLLDRIYNSVKCDERSIKYSSRKEFFNITRPFKVVNKKKKQQPPSNEDADGMKEKYESIKGQLALICSNHCSCAIMGPREAANNCYNDAKSRKVTNVKGGNLAAACAVGTVNGEQYLIPPFSHFYNFDVKEMPLHVEGKFDVILLDPPWWNKYIRRKRKKNSEDGYSMMWNKELGEIPVGSFLASEGLVVVWCTNASSHMDALINEIFPKWGVKFIAQWFWLKVTQSGEVVTPFSSANGKQPYERIVFGARDATRSIPLPAPCRVIVSVPSAIHSHKPPLCDLLQPYLPANPRGLEIFARNLLPNWTSYGNEVLKLQHISLFTQEAAAS